MERNQIFLTKINIKLNKKKKLTTNVIDGKKKSRFWQEALSKQGEGVMSE